MNFVFLLLWYLGFIPGLLVAMIIIYRDWSMVIPTIIVFLLSIGLSYIINDYIRREDIEAGIGEKK